VLGRVLLVDDDPSVIEAVSRAIVGEPLEVHAAANAEAALDLLDRLDFDVILSDDDMPGMSGIELLGVVHRRHPEVVRIIYTGMATVQRAMTAINQGRIFQYLLKPCRAAEIVNIFRLALEERRKNEATAHALSAARKQHRVLRELTKELGDLAPLLDSEEPLRPPADAVEVRPLARASRDTAIGFGGLAPSKLALLTPREKDFLRALASGKHVKDSAVLLNISVHTARNHMKALLRKLGVKSQIELLAKLFGRES
jgi:DNA-binding NarL/FixJ family response regulator